MVYLEYLKEGPLYAPEDEGNEEQEVREVEHKGLHGPVQCTHLIYRKT